MGGLINCYETKLLSTLVISLLAWVAGDEGMDLEFILSGCTLPRYMGQEIGHPGSSKVFGHLKG